MLPRIALLSLILIVFEGTELFAQYEFNPRSVLVLTKDDTVKQRVFTQGMKVKAKLKNGIKLKGKILIYPDHLIIENERAELSQIQEIKLATRTVRNAFGGLIVGTTVNQIRDNGSGTLLFIESAVGVVMSILLLDKRYKRDKGWNYTIENLDRMNTFRRF